MDIFGELQKAVSVELDHHAEDESHELEALFLEEAVQGQDLTQLLLLLFHDPKSMVSPRVI